jgi:hypothetical protein
LGYSTPAPLEKQWKFQCAQTVANKRGQGILTAAILQKALITQGVAWQGNFATQVKSSEGADANIA